jgi:hypothetical protein
VASGADQLVQSETIHGSGAEINKVNILWRFSNRLQTHVNLIRLS